jgi:hypothetical protein
MKNYPEYINSLTKEKKDELLKHFKSIYECAELQELELGIIYLAYLWRNGKVYRDGNGMAMIDDVYGVKYSDYELSIEVEDGGGINLDVMFDYYDFNTLMAIV